MARHFQSRVPPVPFFRRSICGTGDPAVDGGILHGYAVGPGSNALGWHGHEMIFGYVAAVVAGIVITAIPNWTVRLSQWRIGDLASALSDRRIWPRHPRQQACLLPPKRPAR